MPPPSDHLLIRADAGGHLGTGHVMRMIALAQAWQDRGGQVTLASCQCPTGLENRLIQEGIKHMPLGELPLGGEEELAATESLARKIDTRWIVIDGYHFSSNYQKSLKEHGFKVLAVDDYGHCENWYADLVLNQNVYGSDFPYPMIDVDTKILRGPRFGLLRREFRGKAPKQKHQVAKKSKLLLSFGGVDPDNATGKVIKALNTLRDQPLHLRVLVGAGNPHQQSLFNLASESPHRIDFLTNVTDMPEQYGWAQGIVGAGGTTCLEWLLFSLPAALVRVAANQNLVVDTLAKNGRSLDLGWHESLEVNRVAKMLADWIGHSTEVDDSFFVDAWGANRVAAHIDDGLWIRPAAIEDCELYFRWANDPLVRQNAIHTGKISWDDHSKWFVTRIASRDVRFFLCFDEANQPVGQVRFERKSRPEWEIDISVDPKSRRNRLGHNMMSLAFRTFRVEESGAILAIVKSSNPASLKIFKSLGFTSDAESDDQLVYLTA